ncbi:MAG: aspartate--tRNA ligase [Dehalococcoidales bacterium]|nr:aspartate--tRNA ligase [Dehalococcoidales bacterium]
MLKNQNCGELNKTHVGQQVTLAGWVDRRRDHGGLIFIDLRDRSGVAQVVFNPQIADACHERATQLRNEYVITISGEVSRRPKGTENSKIPTGDIEIAAKKITILNASKTPPFYINEEAVVDENLRLKYRYLDLRRPPMQKTIILRHKLVKLIRDFLDELGFIEIETPILIKSTPEGARDYLVPSRVHPGKFYALPQSPQQMKQLLMVAGMEKYFQIAKCFRDEDTRADRQPEFTQIDIEMSFAEEEDIIRLMEDMVVFVVEKLRPDVKLTRPFPRLSYHEAMECYGCDKPDLRFGLQIKDLSDIASQTEFSVFRSVISAGGKVKGIVAPGCGGYSRSQLEELNQFVRGLGAGGVVTVALGTTPGELDKLTMENVKSVAAKYLTLEQVLTIARRLDADVGDLLLIVAGKPKLVNTVLSELRREIGRRLKLADPNTLNFSFIVDFPLLEKGDKAGEWEPVRHPFTLPVEEDIPLLESAPEKVRSHSYDLICNGYELGGGSLRIYTRDLQKQVFRMRGYADEEIEQLFGHMLEAFDYGAPPHGGTALGLDRLVMLLAGADTIREVIAFPKNQQAADLTLNAPSPVTEAQLAELHLKIRYD